MKCPAVETDFPDTNLSRAVKTEQVDAAEQGADALGEGGCQSRCAYAPSEHAYKHQVQHHVNDGGDHQIIKRMAAVAQGVEDAHENIVHDGEQCAEEIVAEIGNGLGEHILRRAHPPKNGGGEGDAQHSQQRSRGKAHGDVRMDGPTHGGIVPGAVAPGNHNACAHGHTIEKADHHENQTSGGTDRRQGRVPQKASHDPGVKGVIELLEHISQKNGKGKQQHTLPNGALCERALFLHHGK